MSTTTNLDIGHGIAEAMNAGDLPRLLSFLAEDVQVDEPTGVPWSGTFTGHDGFQELIGSIASRLQVEILKVDVLDNPDGLLAVRMRARFTSIATSRSVESSVAEVDEVVDGLVRRIDVFYKQPELMQEIYAEGH